MIYRRRASPIHAARASVSAAFVAALGTLALAYSNPIVLAALLVTLTAVAGLAGVWRPFLRSLRFALPFGLAIVVLNPLVSHQGLTVLARLGDLGPLGRVDVTLEALVAGAILALKAVAIVVVAALASVTVDPDQVLRLFRRISVHSALTAALATRMVPLLAADARRLAEAQRCRPGGAGRDPFARVAIVRAVVGGALDRALDVAATLEVRGYGTARRAPRAPRPWSRHDLAFAAAAAALAGLALARAGGWAPFVAYPGIAVGVGPDVIASSLLIAVVSLAPFADRRGIEP